MSETLRVVQGDRLTFDLKLTLHNERYELGYNEKVYFNVFTRSYEPDSESEQLLYIEQESTTISIDKVELDPGEYNFDAGIIFSDGTTKTVLPCIKNQRNTLQVLDKTCIDRYDIRGSIYDEAFDASIKDSMCNCAEIERIYRLIAKMDSNSFMTVQNISELDEIPKNRIANGKLVRVEDNGDGQSEYFSYDKDTDRWIPEYIVNDGMLPSIFGTSDVDIVEYAYKYGIITGTTDMPDEEEVVRVNGELARRNTNMLYLNTDDGKMFLCYECIGTSMSSPPFSTIKYDCKWKLLYSDYIPLLSVARQCALRLEIWHYKNAYSNPIVVKQLNKSDINSAFYEEFTLMNNDSAAVEFMSNLLSTNFSYGSSGDPNIYKVNSGEFYSVYTDIAIRLVEFVNSSDNLYTRSQRLSRIISMAARGFVPKNTLIAGNPLLSNIEKYQLASSIGNANMSDISREFNTNLLPSYYSKDTKLYVSEGSTIFHGHNGYTSETSHELINDGYFFSVMSSINSHFTIEDNYVGSYVKYIDLITNSVPFYYSDNDNPPSNSDTVVSGKSIISETDDDVNYHFRVRTNRIGGQFYTTKDGGKLFLIKGISDSTTTVNNSEKCIRNYEWERIALYKDAIHVGNNVLNNTVVFNKEDSTKGHIRIDLFSRPMQIYMTDRTYDGTGTYGAGSMSVTSETGSMAAAKRHTIGLNTRADCIGIYNKYITSTLENNLLLYNNRIERYYAKSLYNYGESGYATDTFTFPRKSGTFALLDDIPDVSGFISAPPQYATNNSTALYDISQETRDSINELNDGQFFFLQSSYHYKNMLLMKATGHTSPYGYSSSTSAPSDTVRLALYEDINSLETKMNNLTPPVSLSYCGNLQMSYPMDIDASAFHEYNNPDHQYSQIWGHDNESVRPGTIIHNGYSQHSKYDITQLWMVTASENKSNMGNVYQNYWTVPIPVIRTDAIMKRLNKISVSQYSDIANVDEGQIFKYNGRYCVRTGHGEEYDYAYEDLSTGEYNLAHISDIPDNINKESGYVYDTALFSVEEGLSGVVINGTYVLEGDYCKIDAEAKLIENWGIIYYNLPVVAIATGCSIEHHVDGKQYSIRTMPQNGNVMNVLGIRRLDNSNLDSNPSTIHFHLEYKYR